MNPTTPSPGTLTRIASLASPQAFRDRVAQLGILIPCDNQPEPAPQSPLAQPIPADRFVLNGKTLFNRIAIQPMEGWDASTDGAVTPPMLRRWQRFGESGASLLFGGEAMAVRPDGRANPNQLILSRENQPGIAALRSAAVQAHQTLFGPNSNPIIGFQLTHSGRFCRPTDKRRMEPRTAFRHPLLDPRFHIHDDSALIRDDEIPDLIQAYVRAARVAYEAGADFVDLKHCHGYLLHEFLGAHTRPGPFGGSFENRTRILRTLIEEIRADNNPIAIGIRLSAFDLVPFHPDPSTSTPGSPGRGIPERFEHLLPYHLGFGINPDNPLEPDLTEPHRFVRLCHQLGVRILNLSAGSPYYNPHILRPAAHPPSDGYLPPHDPLIDVARQLWAVRELKAKAPPNLLIVGSGYSYLQDFLPHVAQAVVRRNETDLVGIGRSVLSYPSLFPDVFRGTTPNRRQVCRTLSDCTTAPRNGLPSGCYPLDPHYASQPAAAELKTIKRTNRSTPAKP